MAICLHCVCKSWGRGGAFTIARRRVEKIDYKTEANRGYAAVGELWSPGCFSADLEPGRSSTLIASTSSWDAMGALSPEDSLEAEHVRRHRLLALADPHAAGNFGQQLVLAADQFLITPGRPRGRCHARTRRPRGMRFAR